MRLRAIHSSLCQDGATGATTEIYSNWNIFTKQTFVDFTASRAQNGHFPIFPTVILAAAVLPLLLPSSNEATLRQGNLWDVPHHTSDCRDNTEIAQTQAVTGQHRLTAKPSQHTLHIHHITCIRCLPSLQIQFICTVCIASCRM